MRDAESMGGLAPAVIRRARGSWTGITYLDTAPTGPYVSLLDASLDISRSHRYIEESAPPDNMLARQLRMLRLRIKCLLSALESIHGKSIHPGSVRPKLGLVLGHIMPSMSSSFRMLSTTAVEADKWGRLQGVYQTRRLGSSEF